MGAPEWLNGTKAAMLIKQRYNKGGNDVSHDSSWKKVHAIMSFFLLQEDKCHSLSCCFEYNQICVGWHTLKMSECLSEPTEAKITALPQAFIRISHWGVK